MKEYQNTKKLLLKAEETFVVKEIKNTVPYTYVINDINGEEIIGTFYEKELQKTNKKKLK